MSERAPRSSIQLEDFDDDEIPAPECSLTPARTKPGAVGAAGSSPSPWGVMNWDVMVLPGGVHPPVNTPQQAKARGWTPLQMLLMPGLASLVLKPEDLSSFLKPSLRNVPAERIAGLTPQQISGLTLDQLASLTPQQIRQLASGDWGAMGGLNPETQQALESVRAMKEAGICVCWWTADKLAAMPAHLLLALEAEQIAALTVDQIQRLPEKWFSSLLPEQALALRPDLISALSPAQAQALMSAEMIHHLEAAQLAAVTEDQIAGWPPEVAAFFKAVRRVATLEDLHTWPASKCAGLSNLQLQSLAPSQVASLSGDQLSALPHERLAAFSPEQLSEISPAAMSALPASHILSLLHNAAQLSALSPSQLAALPQPGSPKWNELPADLRSAITAARFVHVASPAEVSKWTTDQMQVLTFDQVAAMSPELICQLSAAQLAALPPELMAALTPAQLAGLPPVVIAALPPDHIAGLSAPGSSLSPGQLAALSSDQVSRLSPSAQVAVRALLAVKGQLAVADWDSGVLGGFTAQQVEALSSEQLQQLTADQVAGIPVSALAGLSEDQVAALSPDILAALSPDLIAALPPALLAALTPAQALALSESALAGLPAEVKAMMEGLRGHAQEKVRVRRLSKTEVVEEVAPEQLGLLAPDQLAQIKHEQIQALTEDQVEAMTEDQILALSEEELSGVTANSKLRAQLEERRTQARLNRVQRDNLNNVSSAVGDTHLSPEQLALKRKLEEEALAKAKAARGALTKKNNALKLRLASVKSRLFTAKKK